MSMNCGCNPEPEPDEAAEMLARAACEAGVHGTRTLGPCPHSPRPTSNLLTPAFVVREALEQIRWSAVMTRLVNRRYDRARRGVLIP